MVESTSFERNDGSQVVYLICAIVKLKKSGFHPTRKHVGFSPLIYNTFRGGV